MKAKAARLLAALLSVTLSAALPAGATDVDGPDDCTRSIMDFGDAPDGSLAYPGVIGRFPTCTSLGPGGAAEISCPFGLPPPAFSGFVRNVSVAGSPNYWLGCGAAAPLGVDSEPDGKVNSTGAPNTFCAPIGAVDCTQSAFGLTFGQDECLGDDDAGLIGPLSFSTCTATSVSFRTYSCSPVVRIVYLNILVDWTHDGDWNDASQACATCVPEWAVRNQQIDLPPGCFTQTSQVFMTGNTAGPTWMRITVSDTPVNDDFPWAGSANIPGGSLSGGETEDYPVAVVTPPPPCKSYLEFGDAPEGIPAYPSGIPGHFPTCRIDTPPGTAEQVCPDPSLPPPGLTGYVQHATVTGDNVGYWLGCGDVAAPLLGVDSEPDGRSWLMGPLGQVAACDRLATPDCIEPAFGGGLTFGQDECYGDADAGIAALVRFTACRGNSVTTRTYSCATVAVQAWLNILVDWNGDGDWNDILPCDGLSECAPEWAVRNQLVSLAPGCGSLTSKMFLGGPTAGPGWMRVTLSERPAPDDFPWRGTVSLPGMVFTRGETEDYPVEILPTPVGLGEDRSSAIAFAPPAPNPATGSCSFSFTLPNAEDVSLVVYDVAGRERARVVQGHFGPGAHQFGWDFRGADGAELQAGLYVARLHVGGVTLTRSVMHVR
jgi:hypothetical protein